MFAIQGHICHLPAPNVIIYFDIGHPYSTPSNGDIAWQKTSFITNLLDIFTTQSPFAHHPVHCQMSQIPLYWHRYCKGWLFCGCYLLISWHALLLLAVQIAATAENVGNKCVREIECGSFDSINWIIIWDIDSMM